MSGVTIHHFRDLEVYRLAYEMQQTLFRISRDWPREERFALTDQLRRSSRSIGANLAEAWAKRRYPAHFLSKLTDYDGELQESCHWIATATDCGYLPGGDRSDLDARCVLIGRKLGAMMAKHEKFCL